MLGRVRGKGGKEKKEERREIETGIERREKREVSYALASFFLFEFRGLI